MILYADVGTANLGDFCNCLPVLSGIYKKYGKISLIIQNDMQKFSGIKEFLLAQEMFDVVGFEYEVEKVSGDVLSFNSWVPEISLNDVRPIETCRYEMLFKSKYNLDFNTDDDFILNVPYDESVEYTDLIIVGDRCLTTTSDKRRKCGLLEMSGKFNDCLFLDYNKPILYNLNLIKKSKHIFVTTVTGISVLVDLMNIPQDIYYDEEIIIWDNRTSIDDTFNRHFYKNRNSKMKYLKTIG